MVGGRVFAHRLRRFCSGEWSPASGLHLPWSRAERLWCRSQVPSASHLCAAVFQLVFALALLVHSLGCCGTFDVFYGTIPVFTQLIQEIQRREEPPPEPPVFDRPRPSPTIYIATSDHLREPLSRYRCQFCSWPCTRGSSDHTHHKCYEHRHRR